MASMNAGIILAGQQPNFLNTIATANQAAAQQNQFQQQNALRDFNRENGAAVLAGDQNALNQYAGIAGPEAALGIQGQQQNMRINQEELGIRRQTAARQAEAWAQQQDDRTKAETAQKIKQGLMSAGQAFQAGDEAAFNRILQENGVDPFPMSEFPYKAAEFEGVLDAIAAASQFGKPPPTEYDIIDGQYVPKTPGKPAQPIQGFQKSAPTPQSRQGKFYADKIEGFIPETEQFSGDGTVINNNMGGDVTDKFYENVDKGQADMFVGLSNEGLNVPSKLAQLDQLDTLLAQSPSGAEAVFKSFLGSYGINTEGLDTLQAAKAIISQLVPGQRAPGSGTMSDADLALFKASLPRLINMPGGNKLIINAIRGIAVYQQKQGEIANAVISREMTPAEGRKALYELENPLNVLRREGTTTIGGGYTIREVK